MLSCAADGIVHVRYRPLTLHFASVAKESLKPALLLCSHRPPYRFPRTPPRHSHSSCPGESMLAQKDALHLRLLLLSVAAPLLTRCCCCCCVQRQTRIWPRTAIQAEEEDG